MAIKSKIYEMDLEASEIHIFEVICNSVKHDTHVPDNIDICAPASSLGWKFILKISGKSSIDVFTEGSKYKEEVRGGIFIHEYGKNISFIGFLRIRKLSSDYSNFRVINECRISLNVMARHCHLEFIWVRGHSNSPGNLCC